MSMGGMAAADQLHLWGDDPPDGLRWSISRHKRFIDCRRKYYLHHYGCRGGWQPTAPSEARELYILRGLRTRYMWVGEVVHSLIELAFSAWRRRERVPLGALIERGTRLMRAQYAESRQRVYRERPGGAAGLFEHEYRYDLSREEWRAQRDAMERCLRNFFDLEVTHTIRSLPLWRWLAVESLGSFELDGATVVVKPDFAWRDEDGSVVLVDWKTGMPRPEDERLQLSVYGLFAQRSWGLGVDHVRGIVGYLGTGKVAHLQLARHDLAEAEEAVRASLHAMRAATPDLQAPLSEHFPATQDLERCVYCCFKRVCGRDQVQPR